MLVDIFFLSAGQQRVKLLTMKPKRLPCIELHLFETEESRENIHSSAGLNSSFCISTGNKVVEMSEGYDTTIKKDYSGFIPSQIN